MNTLQVARDGSKSKRKGCSRLIFTCDNGWEIASQYENDGECDCAKCEDESQWTCQTCGGCPTCPLDWRASFEKRLKPEVNRARAASESNTNVLQVNALTFTQKCLNGDIKN
eukprot:g671.t1